jgi:hypothetical protein
MRVIKKNAEQLAHVWPGGGKEDLPDWLAHRVIRYGESTDTLVLKNGVHQITAGAGDAIVLGQDHTLSAWSEPSFAAQFDVYGQEAGVVERIARVCHEANRAYCLALGDKSQKPWEKAPEWQRASAIEGVKFHIANPGAPASASHENWMKQKAADGWIFGEAKDEEKKTHPCMVAFDKLPVEQQAKDHIFAGIVAALS